MKKHLLLIIFSIAIGLLLFIFNALSSDLIRFKYIQWHILVVIIISILTGYVLKSVSLILDKYISWANKIGARLIIGIISSYLILIIALGLTGFIHISFLGAGEMYNLKSELVTKLLILIGIMSIIGNVLYLAYYSYNHYSEKQIQNIQLERQQIDLQLNALKAQISPHFLFNNLNTISYLIYEDKIKAEKFIRKMANCYQYILDSYNDVVVKVKDELKFVDSYRFLLQTKHDNTLRIEKNLSLKDLEAKIPSLSLQLLVENASKHNESSIENPVIIKLSADEKNIIVSNNKTTKPKEVKSTAIGLKNIKQRYKLLSSHKIEIQDNNFFTVKLPKLK